jgi:hypothetical protein
MNIRAHALDLNIERMHMRGFATGNLQDCLHFILFARQAGILLVSSSPPIGIVTIVGIARVVSITINN